MIRTILWFAFFWLRLLATLPNLLRVRRLEAKGMVREHDELTHKVSQAWAGSLLWAAGAKVTVYGEEKIPADQPVLFVSNHQGSFDIPLLISQIGVPKAFVAKIEMEKMPGICTWMKHMKCVFMDRSDIRQSLTVINEAAKQLKAGYSTVIFPEGSRSKGPEMGEFKAGSLKLAMKAGVPIVPIAIKGSYRLMEKQGFKIRPASVEITVFDPVPTKGLSKDEVQDLPQRVKDIIRGGVEENQEPN